MEFESTPSILLILCLFLAGVEEKSLLYEPQLFFPLLCCKHGRTLVQWISLLLEQWHWFQDLSRFPDFTTQVKTIIHDGSPEEPLRLCTSLGGASFLRPPSVCSLTRWSHSWEKIFHPTQQNLFKHAQEVSVHLCRDFRIWKQAVLILFFLLYGLFFVCLFFFFKGPSKSTEKKVTVLMNLKNNLECIVWMFQNC